MNYLSPELFEPLAGHRGDILGCTCKRVADPSDKTKHHYHSFPENIFCSQRTRLVGQGSRIEGWTRDLGH